MKEELKPCPFCGAGGETVLLQNVYRPYFVICRNCGARIEEKNKAEVLKKWNRRDGQE